MNDRSLIYKVKLIVLSILVTVFTFAGSKTRQVEIDTIPQWAKEAVWYQIFPERFWNGDRSNDPAPEDMAGGWPYFIPENWQIHPWTSDWYKFQPWEKNIDWHSHFDWAKPGELNFSASAGLRRYGGDLQGVLDRLDYLQKLGITAIYFNPVFESPSLHKYDAAMFHHIDNNFGPDPARDRQIWEKENPADPSTWQWTTADKLFLQFIQECHRRGIKVIIDGVFNHTGVTFWAFQDILRNQQKSPYKDWFVIKQLDDPATPENEFEYEGWNGVKDLPEIREDENGLVSGPRQHIHDVVKRWMDPNGDGDPSDGIDGWRLDVAEKVNINFWREFRLWVKEINPDAYITGEIWWEDWRRNKMFNAAPWFEGAFDAVMNYRFARAVKKFVIDIEQQIPAQGFVDSLQAIYRDYRRDNMLACQNLMDSHDVDRIASQIVNPDRWYDHDANAMQNPDYNVRKLTEREYQKQRLIAGLQMTLPGAPMIYYGDEAGMWGGDDPDCRKPMVWPDLQYDVERTHPLGKPRSADSVKFDLDLFEWYRKLISIRRQHPELAYGNVEFFLADNAQKVLGFVRESNGEKLFVLVNNRETQSTVLIDFQKQNLPTNVLTNLLDESTFEFAQTPLDISLEPYETIILKTVETD